MRSDLIKSRPVFMPLQFKLLLAGLVLMFAVVGAALVVSILLKG